MRKKPPCKDCFRRKLLCHTMCEEFKAWKTEDQRRKEIRDKEKEKEQITFSIRVVKAMDKKSMDGRK